MRGVTRPVDRSRPCRTDAYLLIGEAPGVAGPQDGDVRADYDFHPDESTVRVFTTPASGVLQLDDDVAITEVIQSGVVLRHYAFGDRWFKINVTTDQQGGLVETGAPHQRFAFNCDIATPMGARRRRHLRRRPVRVRPGPG